MTQNNEPIRTLRPEWTLVMDRLILVDLHVGRWRAAARAEFREFGLDGGAFQAYTAGVRRLLPKAIHDELQTLERLARDLLESYSIRTLFGHLMPKERYEEFKAWIEERPAADLRLSLHGTGRCPEAWQTASLKQRWFALAEEIAAARDSLVDQMVETYRPSAVVRWRVENRLPRDAEVLPPDTWLDETLAGMVQRIPSADSIRRSFRLDIAPAFVEAPDEAVKATKLEAIQRAQAEVDRRLAELDQIHIDAEREKTRLELQAEREKLYRERRITEEVIAYEKRVRQERIEKTLDEVAGQLHTLVYTAVCDGLGQIQSKGKLHPRWVGRVKNLVEQVRRLDFTDDAELARVCAELEKLAGQQAASQAKAEQMRAALVDAGISLKADLVAANVTTRSARELGIPDEPLPDLVRKARRETREADLFDQAGITVLPVERGMRVLEPVAASVAG